MSMTESDALEVLKKPTEHIRAEDDDCIFSSAYARALETAMEALEEIQQYRAIGTVEDIKKVISFLSSDSDNSITDDLNLLNEYRFIGTVSEFRELKEKATAKKPIPYVPDCASINFIEFVCPNCKGDVPQMLTPRYCNCGQKLDWSEGKE